MQDETARPDEEMLRRFAFERRFFIDQVALPHDGQLQDVAEAA